MRCNFGSSLQFIHHSPVANFLDPILPRPLRHRTPRTSSWKHIFFFFFMLSKVLQIVSTSPRDRNRTLLVALSDHRNRQLGRFLRFVLSSKSLAALHARGKFVLLRFQYNIFVLHLAHLENSKPGKIQHGKENLFFTRRVVQ